MTFFLIAFSGLSLLSCFAMVVQNRGPVATTLFLLSMLSLGFAILYVHSEDQHYIAHQKQIINTSVMCPNNISGILVGFSSTLEWYRVQFDKDGSVNIVEYEQHILEQLNPHLTYKSPLLDGLFLSGTD